MADPIATGSMKDPIIGVGSSTWTRPALLIPLQRRWRSRRVGDDPQQDLPPYATAAGSVEDSAAGEWGDGVKSPSSILHGLVDRDAQLAYFASQRPAGNVEDFRGLRLIAARVFEDFAEHHAFHEGQRLGVQIGRTGSGAARR